MNKDQIIPTKTLFLDTETTRGLDSGPKRDGVVEIAIVDDGGRTVLNSLIRPPRKIGDAKAYHGITDDVLKDKPTLVEFYPTIEAIVTGCHVVMWNAKFDCRFLPHNLQAAGHISCAMKRFAPHYGQYSEYHGDYTDKSLKDATGFIGYKWTGKSHRALPDALACRAVWQWMECRDNFGGMTPDDIDKKVKHADIVRLF